MKEEKKEEEVDDRLSPGVIRFGLVSEPQVRDLCGGPINGGDFTLGFHKTRSSFGRLFGVIFCIGFGS